MKVTLRNRERPETAITMVLCGAHEKEEKAALEAEFGGRIRYIDHL
jgi:hypothetical protein